MLALRLVRRPEAAERSAADDRAATVGNRRRDGCHVPSGQRICGPAIPQRGLRVGERDERRDGTRARRARRGSRRARTRPSVAAIPRLTFAANVKRPRVLEDAHAVRDAADGAGHVRDHDDLVDLRARGPGSERSSSRACPCETTTAETFTPRVSPGRRRASARRRLRQLNARARSRPAATSLLALGERLAGSRPRARPPRRTTAASPATSTQRRIRNGDDRRPARHRLDDGEPEALVARSTARGRRRRDRARRAARSSTYPSSLRPARAELGRERRVLRRADDDERKTDRRRRLERRELVLPRLDRADREHVVARPVPG